MLERLLEGWLDSASERSYQGPFCQILSAKGYKILHSTRHSALEFGKDIIAIGPDGKTCAFQLKGNPGARLSLSEFRDIQNQLVQLVTQPVIYPGLGIAPHRSFLVTNGIVEEEVHRALDDLNRGWAAQCAIGHTVELISRGQLLADIQLYGANLWPSELENVNNLLSLLVKDGKESYSFELASELLKEVLLLEETIPNKVSANEIKRRITSAALLTAATLRNFYRENNHYSIICGWCMYATHAVACIERHGKSYKQNAKEAVDIAMASILAALSDLCDEIKDKGHLVEGDPLADAVTYRGRYTLVVALMSVYWFWGQEAGFLKEGHDGFLQKFLPRDFTHHYLWGEGAVPQFLIYIWYLRATEAGIRPDFMLGELLKQIVGANTQKNEVGLSSPYYGFEDKIRFLMKEFLGIKEDPYHDTKFQNSSYFAKPLLNLLVRTNFKVTSKSVWPSYSKMLHKHFEPEEKWMYCLYKSAKGTNVDDQPPLTKEWQELQQEARECRCLEVPESLVENKYLIMLFCIVLPYRAIPSVISKLDRYFNGSWFIREPPVV
ncbi:hypothetical protein KI809_04980 [Geobacter pelophilus]|uniref:Uncharacterized protein n=1 Tax=Geoanaerobacter pelophilus TaxID=60036 RepID=A0AAW4L621_9BACT|nr:hypothetical protein [Geoanaerobacter pelophilus]MBT0663651.1 hypothetical protein [Geoanaerobacter pelophilus]